MAEFEPGKRANVLIGAALIAVGALFIIGRLFHINVGEFVWPFFIIIPGAMFFVGMVYGGKAAGPLAIPGSIVTMTGLILLYQSMFDTWATWAYVWTLIFPTSVGIGLMINGMWSDTPSLVKTGSRWTMAGLIMFLVVGAFFELILNLTRNSVNDVLWPLLLIGIGIWLLQRRRIEEALPRLAERVTARANGHDPAKVEKPPVVPSNPIPPNERPKQAPTEFEPLDPTRGKRKKKSEE